MSTPSVGRDDLPAGDDLTSLQWDILRVVIEEPRYGQPIKRALDARYDTEVSASRLYSNLKTLVEAGVLEKSERDGRSSTYHATDRAQQAFCARLRWHLAAVTDLPGELPDVIDEELSVREQGSETACDRVRARVDGGDEQ